MNTTDQWDDVKAAGQVPPPSSEVLAHARHQLETARSRRAHTIRRRLVVATLAAAGTAAVVIGAVGVYRTGSSTVPATAPGVTAPSASGGTSTGKPSQGAAASCADSYSPARLKQRAFAFDGTVQKIVRDSGGTMPSYLVTLQIHEWFRPGRGARLTTVRTYNPPERTANQVSVDFPEYTIGSRLLITGEPQWGGADPLKDAYAFGCGYSRTYTAADAATWREILKK